MLGYFHDDSSLFLVLQYAPHGDLLSMLRTTDCDESLAGAQRIVFQLCEAVAYLHTVQVAHREQKTFF
jgi:serine/threonine protein kinase